LSIRSRRGTPFSTRITGTPSIHFSDRAERCFNSDRPMSMPINVEITSAEPAFG
jgi:hypothetical protein